MKGQLSAELIILVAVILAIALLVATQLRSTAMEANKLVDKEANAIFKTVNKSTADEPKAKGDVGDKCSKDSDCNQNLLCVYNQCV